MAALSKTLFFVLSILIVFLAGCNEDFSSQKDNHDISTIEAQAMISEHAGDPNFMIIDVRSENNFKREHLKNAVNIRYTASDFSEVMQQYGKEKTYLFYCLSGASSRIAMQQLMPLGFHKIYNLEGGIMDWKDAGFEVITE